MDPQTVYFPRKFPRSGPLFILLHIIPILWLRSGASCKRKHWASPVYHWVPWWEYKASMISMTHWEPWQQEDKQFSQLDDLSNLQHAQQADLGPLASCISGSLTIDDPSNVISPYFGNWTASWLQTTTLPLPRYSQKSVPISLFTLNDPVLKATESQQSPQSRTSVWPQATPPIPPRPPTLAPSLSPTEPPFTWSHVDILRTRYSTNPNWTSFYYLNATINVVCLLTPQQSSIVVFLWPSGENNIPLFCAVTPPRSMSFICLSQLYFCLSDSNSYILP